MAGDASFRSSPQARGRGVRRVALPDSPARGTGADAPRNRTRLRNMGFMDKAKKMAEQAQAKLDEAQQQFNSGQQSEQGSAPTVEYDEHGRPVAQAQAPTASPHGDPLAEQAQSTPPPTPGLPATGPGEPPGSPAAPPIAQPGVTPTADAPDAPPARPEADAADEDRNKPSYAPPKLSSGDPLAG